MVNMYYQSIANATLLQPPTAIFNAKLHFLDVKNAYPTDRVH